MEQYDIYEAKKHLSSLLERVLLGESFIIAKAGKPITQIGPIEKVKKNKCGFLKGQMVYPDNFDEFFQDEIVSVFQDGDV